MEYIFFILFVLSFIALLVGLFKPSSVLKEFPQKVQNRSTVIKLYLTATIFFFLLTGSTANDGFFSASTIILLIIFILIIGYLFKDVPLSEEEKETFTQTEEHISQTQKPEPQNSADIEFLYQKSDGEITKRKVKVEKVDEEYLKGFCFLRGEERTFKLSRIIELKDLSTGLVFDNPEEIKDFLIASFPYEDIVINSIDHRNTADKNYVDDGYFYGKVDDKEAIADINHNFHIVYQNRIEFDAVVIRLGKEKFTNRYFLLIRNLDNNEFAGLYGDRIIEMFDLDTGESISNPKKYFDEIYEQERQKVFEKERKRMEREKIEDFIDENLDLLKALVYIAKSDGTLNAKEKGILIETLENFDSSIQDPAKIIDKVVKNHLYFTSYNSFAYNMKKIIDKYPEIDFLDYAVKIVSTQKKIHTDEQKILDYLSKAYNREYRLNYKKEFKAKNDIECPHCHSKHTIKKGKREYKDYVSQRYECQECGKIFSIKQEKAVS